MKKYLEKIILYPIFFAITPVFALYFGNIDKFPARVIVAPLLFTCLCTLLAWGAIYLLIRDGQKSALIVTALVVLIFASGLLKSQVFLALVKLNVMTVAEVAAFAFGRQALLLWAMALLLVWAGLFFLVWKASLNMSLLTQLFNIIGLALLINSGVTWLLNRNQRVVDFAATWRSQIAADTFTEQGDISAYPDIYYIIVDGYTNAEILQSIYNLDNAPFLETLQSLGFYVASASHANYPQTALSMAATMNMMYLDEPVAHFLDGRPASTEKNRAPLYFLLDENRLFHYLREKGYKIAAFSSGSAFTELKNVDERLVPPWSLTMFAHELLNSTPLPVITMDIQYALHRRRIRYDFEHLADIASDPEPTFLFAHIMVPHPPFIFTAEGEPIRPDRALIFHDGSHYMEVSGDNQTEYINGYRGHVRFTNTQLLAAIQDILAQSPEPPIIIIQGDHGPGSGLDWGSVENTDVNERLSILNAYFFPAQDYGPLYQDITPVNSFRVVLQQYFGIKMPLLEDWVYYARWDAPYDFIDVTARLRDE